MYSNIQNTICVMKDKNIQSMFCPKHAVIKYILLPRATLSHISEACTIKNVTRKE
jgi:hypothetical protein